MNDKTLFTYALKYQESQKFGANLIIQKASPHLSLYDGEDRTFAWALFSLLKEFSWQIQLALTNISIIEKKKEFSN